MIGKIHRVPLREVFKHEALDFTRWLQENVDILNDALNLSLSGAERERAAGDFSVDLVAEDDNGNPVVIENQLEKSDHDHLGKLLTYLVAVGAKTAVWIVSEPRNEHVRAVSWLNESSSADFYLAKIEAIKIAESPPAPLLTQVVGPSAESREVGKSRRSGPSVRRCATASGKSFWRGPAGRRKYTPISLLPEGGGSAREPARLASHTSTP